MAKIETGKYRIYGVFERPKKSQDDGGGIVTDGWEEVGRAFISVQPMGTFERMRSQREGLKTTHWIKVQNPGFLPTNDMRFRVLTSSTVPAEPAKSTDRIFDIDGVMNLDEAGFEYVMPCSEVDRRK